MRAVPVVVVCSLSVHPDESSRGDIRRVFDSGVKWSVSNTRPLSRYQCY